MANEERDQVRVSRRSGGRDDAELHISDAVNPILLAYEFRADANFAAVVVLLNAREYVYPRLPGGSAASSRKPPPRR